MSSLYLRGGNWYVQYTERERTAAGEPEKRRFSLSTDDERTARTLQARADFLYDTGAWDPWAEDLEHAVRAKEREGRRDELVLMGRLRGPAEAGAWAIVEAAREFLARPELRDGTRRSYKSVLEQMLTAAPPDPATGQLDKSKVGAWLRTGSEGRQASYYRTLRNFERWAAANGYVPDGTSFTPPSTARNSNRLVFFTPRDVDTVTNHLDTLDNAVGRYLAPVVRTAVYLGLRLSEYTAARVDWFDPNHQRLVVPAESGKSKRNDPVYVPSVVLPVVEAQAAASRSGYLFEYRGRTVTPHHLGRVFTAEKEAAGVAHGTFHTLRHTCASWLAQGGAPAYAVQKQMRHASIETTLRYMHLGPEHYEELIEHALATHGDLYGGPELD